jgi:hypothetical protein
MIDIENDPYCAFLDKRAFHYMAFGQKGAVGIIFDIGSAALAELFFLCSQGLTHRRIEKKFPPRHNTLSGGYNLHTHSTKTVHPINKILIEL